MTASKSSYARVNGLNMYYEIHGEGHPLVLLHGALSAIGTSFGRLLPDLAKERQVIAVEMQGHGHTADIERPLRYEQLADDIATLLTQIGIEQADLFGWSLGAGVALQTAKRHPESVRKLVLASVTYNSGGLYPELLAGIAHAKPEDLAGTPFVSDKNPGLQKKRETRTVKANESLLNHRRRSLSCTYKYRSKWSLRQAQVYPRWNSRFKKPGSLPCARR